MQNKEALGNFPEELRALPQWILWRFEIRERKQTKVPYQPNGRHAAVNRPNEWSTFEDCLAAADNFDGLGFVFTEGVIGIDLDKCFEYDGTLKTFAQDTLMAFDSYTEFSPSGNGLHVLILSDVPLTGRKGDGIECYSSNRFFTVTGQVYQDRNILRDCDVLSWHRLIFPEKQESMPLPQIEVGYLPDDQTILDVMFSKKNGDKLGRLYRTGDWKQAGYPSQSNADLALVGSLMFYCRNDQATVDRLFRASALMRPKWDEKRGINTYGQNTLAKAASAEVMTWKQPDWEKPGLEFLMSEGKNPVPLVVLENICRVMTSDLGLRDRFRLNDFSHMVEVSHPQGWLNLQDQDIVETLRHISVVYPCFSKVPKEMIVDAIRDAAYHNRVNPPVDYLKGLVWDGIPRLDFWLHKVYGTPPDDLHTAMGANWLKGLVKRVIEPGCQFDEVLVLEGDQGYRKSTSLRVLGSPWHVESTLSTEDKDFYMLLARNAIVEFSEGDIVGRTSARKLKGIITKIEDSFRPPYERGMMTFKRGCVFAMTTNDSDYQKDETGGRRWLPVVLGKIADVEWLAANRDQLYAEAYHRVITLRETTHEYPKEALAMVQREKQEMDDISESIQDWYSGLTEKQREEGVLTLDAYNGALNPDTDNKWTTGSGNAKEIPQQMTWRISKVFRSVLGLRNQSVRKGDRVLKRWVEK